MTTHKYWMGEQPDILTDSLAPRSSPMVKHIALLLIGTILMGLFIALYAIAPLFDYHATKDESAIKLMVALWSLAGAVYLLSVWIIIKFPITKKRCLAWIIFVGVILRISMMPSVPMFEDDFYRYMWDGAVVSTGINPYGWSPMQARENDAPYQLEELADQADHTVYRINHPHMRSIYPPVAQCLFAVTHWIKPFDYMAIRLLIFVFEIVSLLLLLRILWKLKMPLAWVIVYWWNPIVIKDFINGIHMDGLIIPFLLATLLMVVDRRLILAFAALALAIGIKMWPLVLLPILLRFYWPRRKQLWLPLLGFTCLLGLMFIPYFTWHQGQSSGFVRYAQAWQNNTAHYDVVVKACEYVVVMLGYHPGHSYKVARYFLGGLFVCWLLWVCVKPIRNDRVLLWRCVLAVSGLFIISPTQFTWYYCWLVPLLALRPWWPMLLYSVTLPLYHLHYAHPIITWIEHMPIWIALLAYWYYQHKINSANKTRNLNSQVL